MFAIFSLAALFTFIFTSYILFCIRILVIEFYLPAHLYHFFFFDSSFLCQFLMLVSTTVYFVFLYISISIYYYTAIQKNSFTILILEPCLNPNSDFSLMPSSQLLEKSLHSNPIFRTISVLFCLVLSFLRSLLDPPLPLDYYVLFLYL